MSHAVPYPADAIAYVTHVLAPCPCPHNSTTRTGRVNGENYTTPWSDGVAWDQLEPDARAVARKLGYNDKQLWDDDDGFVSHVVAAALQISHAR